MDDYGGRVSHFFDRIDWRQPWLSPFQPAIVPIRQHIRDWRKACNAAAIGLDLRNHRGLPLHFVPQSDLPAGMAYEVFISMTGGVPTRDNLHDFFDALVWLTFPRIKKQLNALQAAEIERSVHAQQSTGAIPTGRGRIRDGATIFDENTALIVTRDIELASALRAHRWHEAFLSRRAAFRRDCEVCLFGHALMEKLTAPYKAITAHVWFVTADDAFFVLPPEQKTGWMDSIVAGQLTKKLTTANFTPIPILGIPGWWPAQDEAFYADASVFRSTLRQR